MHGLLYSGSLSDSPRRIPYGEGVVLQPALLEAIKAGDGAAAIRADHCVHDLLGHGKQPLCWPRTGRTLLATHRQAGPVTGSIIDSEPRAVKLESHTWWKAGQRSLSCASVKFSMLVLLKRPPPC